MNTMSKRTKKTMSVYALQDESGKPNIILKRDHKTVAGFTFRKGILYPAIVCGMSGFSLFSFQTGESYGITINEVQPFRILL